MAIIGELGVKVSVKGLSEFKRDISNITQGVAQTSKSARDSAKVFQDSFKQQEMSAKAFERSLKDLAQGLGVFERTLKSVSNISLGIGAALGAPLIASMNLAAKSNAELNGVLRETRTEIDNVMRSIGSSLVPVVKDVSEVVKTFSDRWKTLTKDERDSIVQTTAWVAIGATLVGVITRIAAALLGFIKNIVNAVSWIAKMNRNLQITQTLLKGLGGGLGGAAAGAGILGLGALDVNDIQKNMLGAKSPGDAIAAIFKNIATKMNPFAAAANFGMTMGQNLVGANVPGAGPTQQATSAGALVGSGIGGVVNASPGASAAVGGALGMGGGAAGVGAQAQAQVQQVNALKQALQTLQQEASVAFGQIEAQMQTMTQTIVTAMTTSFQMFTDGLGQAVAQSIVFGKNFEESMKSVLKNIAAEVIQLLVSTIAKIVLLRALGVVGPISSFALGLGGGGGGGEGGGGGGGFMSGLKKLVGFADGGIVTKPTMGLVGEAGPEAIVPLDQAGQIGGSITVNFNGHTFLDDESAIDKLMRKMQDALVRSTNRRTGGTSLSI